MEVIEYKPALHLQYIKDWLLFRDMDMELANDIPRVGFMVFGNHEFVCAGFLRLVEADYLMLDSLITNPDASSSSRNAAIDRVVKRLIEKAKELGKTRIIAHSTDVNTLQRSLKHGFQHTEGKMIVLNLKGEN